MRLLNRARTLGSRIQILPGYKHPGCRFNLDIRIKDSESGYKDPIHKPPVHQDPGFRYVPHTRIQDLDTASTQRFKIQKHPGRKQPGFQYCPEMMILDSDTGRKLGSWNGRSYSR